MPDSIINAFMGDDAADDAADAQTKAANQATKLQKEMYYQNLALLKPFITTGAAANNELAALMGIGGMNPYGNKYPTAGGGNKQPVGPTYVWVPNGSGTGYTPNGDGYVDNSFMIDMFSKYPQLSERSLGRNPMVPTGMNGGGQWVMQTAGTQKTPVATQQEPKLSREQMQNNAFNRFRASPDYQFRLNEGLDAVASSAAARGGLLSGAAGKAMNKYAQNLASSEYGNYWNRLAQLAGYGQSGVNNAASLGQNYATAAGQNTINAGNARASGYINSANSMMGGVSGLTSGLGTLAGFFL